MTTKPQKEHRIIIAVTIVACFLVWLFLRRNPAVAQAIQNTTGLPVTSIPGIDATPSTYIVGSGTPYNPVALPAMVTPSSCGCRGNPFAAPQITLEIPGNAQQISPVNDVQQIAAQATYLTYPAPFGGSGALPSMNGERSIG